MLTPGSVVRLPVGYVWIGLVVGIGVFVAAYVLGRDHGSARGIQEGRAAAIEEMDPRNVPKMVDKLRKEMRKAAQKLEFEKAAELRDRM